MSISTDEDANNQDPREKTATDTNSSALERPLLEVHGLSTGYGETQVLWNISLDVYAWRGSCPGRGQWRGQIYPVDRNFGIAAPGWTEQSCLQGGILRATGQSAS